MARNCNECGSAKVKTIEPEQYHYTLSGLENVYLRGGVIEYICAECGERSTAIKNIRNLHKVLAFSLISAKRRLDGKELRFLREYLGYSADDLAGIMDYSVETIRKIESNSQKPKATYDNFLKILVLNEQKAPEYDLMCLSEAKEFKHQEYKFTMNKTDWKQAA